VLDALFDGQLISGKSIEVQVPMPGAFDTQGVLEVWPESIAGCRESLDQRQRLTQYHRLGMTLDGGAADRVLRARVPPLQIGVRYCFAVEIRRDYAESQLADAAARVADRLWLAPDAELLRAQAPEAVTAALASVTGQVPEPAMRDRAVQTLIDDLIGSAEWQAAQARKTGFDAQAKVQAAAIEALDQARCVFPAAQDCTRSSPPLPVLPDASPLVLSLTGTVRSYARLAALAPTADLDAIVRDLVQRYPDDARVATTVRLVGARGAARGAGARAAAHQLAIDALHSLRVEPALFDPASKAWVLASRFDPQGRSVNELAELLDQVNQLGGSAPGTEILRWSDALRALKQAKEALARHSLETTAAGTAVEAARASLRAAIARAMTSPAMRLVTHLGIVMVTASSAKSAAADDNAAPIAPQVGLMVAAPLVDGELPWVVPYAAIDIYLKRVDRVIDLDELVGSTTLQKWSFSIGLLTIRPTLNDHAITGLWTEQVPMLSIGKRVTQFIRVDAGGFPFHFRSANPEVSRLRTGGAVFLGASIDLDIWAAAAGKVFK
jgi:hypothetical protein